MSYRDDETDESDSDSREDVQSFKERLKQAKIRINSKVGLKRQPGHYHLRDRGHAVLPERQTAYEGTHWDVSGPLQLQRSTSRLTRHAVNGVVIAEQNRLLREDNRSKEAQAALKAVNKEFDNVIVYNYGRIGIERDKQIEKVKMNKERMNWDLVRMNFGKQINEEQEAERQYRIKVLRGLSDGVYRTPSIEDLVSGIAETNYKRDIVNRDLLEAEDRLEKDTHSVDEEYKTAMSEMLDESLSKIVHCFAAQETRQSFEEEKKRRLLEESFGRNAMQKNELLELIHDEMLEAFEDVETIEHEKDEEYKEKTRDMKAIMQEELLRRVSTKQADAAMTQERVRRLNEIEEGVTDPTINRMRHLFTTVQVQRQILMQKVKGKWVNSIRQPKANVRTNPAIETEIDMKLRKQRESQRRASNIARGDEYF